MAEFVPNESVTVTEKGVIEVTFENGKPLPPGTHIFQLIVEDELGVKSDPVEAKVFVKPQPVARLVAPERVAAGQPFTLDGSESDPQGGEIVKWTFTLLASKEFDSRE